MGWDGRTLQQFHIGTAAEQLKPEGEHRLVHNSAPLFPPSPPFVLHYEYSLNEVSDAASRRVVW